MTDAAAGELPDGFVREGAATGDYADITGAVDVAGGDTDAAAAVGVFTGAGGDEAGAIGSDEAGFGVLQHLLDPDHVADGNAFGDADDEVESGIDAFKDGIGCEGGRDKDCGGGGSGGFDGLGDGIEDGDFVIEELAAASRGDTGYDLGTVLDTEAGMTRAEASGDSLDQNFGLGGYENRHGGR